MVDTGRGEEKCSKIQFKNNLKVKPGNSHEAVLSNHGNLAQ